VLFRITGGAFSPFFYYPLHGEFNPRAFKPPGVCLDSYPFFFVFIFTLYVSWNNIYSMDSRSYKGMLGSLEQEIMDTLWSRGGMSGRAVHEHIHESRPVAITTVLTVMERLRKKGLLKKAKDKGVFIYEAAKTRDEFARGISNRLFKDVLDISTGSATASFVDALAEVDPDELKRLDMLIKKKKKELEKKG